MDKKISKITETQPKAIKHKLHINESQRDANIQWRTEHPLTERQRKSLKAYLKHWKKYLKQ